jgi:hypothetical protein
MNFNIDKEITEFNNKLLIEIEPYLKDKDKFFNSIRTDYDVQPEKHCYLGIVKGDSPYLQLPAGQKKALRNRFALLANRAQYLSDLKFHLIERILGDNFSREALKKYNVTVNLEDSA